MAAPDPARGPPRGAVVADRESCGTARRPPFALRTEALCLSASSACDLHRCGRVLSGSEGVVPGAMSGWDAADRELRSSPPRPHTTPLRTRRALFAGTVGQVRSVRVRLSGQVGRARFKSSQVRSGPGHAWPGSRVKLFGGNVGSALVGGIASRRCWRNSVVDAYGAFAYRVALRRARNSAHVALQTWGSRTGSSNLARRSACRNLRSALQGRGALPTLRWRACTTLGQLQRAATLPMFRSLRKDIQRLDGHGCCLRQEARAVVNVRRLHGTGTEHQAICRSRRHRSKHSFPLAARDPERGSPLRPGTPHRLDPARHAPLRLFRKGAAQPELYTSVWRTRPSGVAWRPRQRPRRLRRTRPNRNRPLLDRAPSCTSNGRSIRRADRGAADAGCRAWTIRSGQPIRPSLQRPLPRCSPVTPIDPPVARSPSHRTGLHGPSENLDGSVPRGRNSVLAQLSGLAPKRGSRPPTTPRGYGPGVAARRRLRPCVITSPHVTSRHPQFPQTEAEVLATPDVAVLG